MKLGRKSSESKKSKVSLYASEKRMSVIFIFPALIFLFFAYIYPLSYSFVLSFFSWNMLVPYAKKTFVGLRNYVNLFEPGSTFLSSLEKTLLFVGVSVSIEFILGLGIALLITSRAKKGMGVLRTGLLVPMMMVPVVIGVLWRELFHSTYGVINYFINIAGFPKQTWLGNPEQALACVITVEIWWQLPVSIFVLAAGIQSLPVNIYEVAKVDGASKWQAFWYLTLPLLSPVILVLLLLRVMDAFKMFDVIYTMTYGGPGSATELLSLSIYKRGLKFFRIGEASAMSWVFLLIVMGICIFFVFRLQKE